MCIIATTLLQHSFSDQVFGFSEHYTEIILLFIEFPFGCVHFYGPHTTKCLQSIWQEVGCLTTGYQYPEKLLLPDLNALNKMNLM